MVKQYYGIQINNTTPVFNGGKIENSENLYPGDMPILTENGYIPICEIKPTTKLYNSQGKLFNHNGLVRKQTAPYCIQLEYGFELYVGENTMVPIHNGKLTRFMDVEQLASLDKNQLPKMFMGAATGGDLNEPIDVANFETDIWHYSVQQKLDFVNSEFSNRRVFNAGLHDQMAERAANVCTDLGLVSVYYKGFFKRGKRWQAEYSAKHKQQIVNVFCESCSEVFYGVKTNESIVCYGNIVVGGYYGLEK